MMTNFKRPAALLAAGLLLGACDIMISPDRVDEGTGATVTVSNDPVANLGGDACAEGSTVEVFLGVEGETPASQGTATAGVAGIWTLDIDAPVAQGSYDVSAACEDVDGGALTLDAEELIVQPVFEPTAEPASYPVDDVPETLTLSGPWCISSDTEEPAPPVVTATLGDQSETVTAEGNQPFGQTWELTLDAPAEVGGHTIEVTCDYLDYVSGEPRRITFGESGPRDTPPTFNEETVEADVLVEVTEPPPTTTTTSTTTTTIAPTTTAPTTTTIVSTTTTTTAPQQVLDARAATPIRMQPSLTG